ncbi:MAG: DUF3105 domain-containing protein [Acidimicrobiales bacterium]
MPRWIWTVIAVTLVAGTSVVAVVAIRPAAKPACAGPIEDPLDPRSLQHSLPGGPPPSYATEPPSSGPHQPGHLAGGVRGEPLAGPVQVGALEEGQVLLQHRDLDPAERSRLEALAGPQVIVAPNPALPARVVASAWRTRQLCRVVDTRALGRFVSRHAGRGA